MTYRALSIQEESYVAAAIADAAKAFKRRSLQQVYDHLLSTNADVEGDDVRLLGFIFGSGFLSEGWLEWAMLLDEEYGDEIGIRVRDGQTGCSPLTMVKNRLEDGESWDLSDLLNATVQRLRELSQHASP